MTWRIVQASAIGTSHHKIGEACEDECFAESLRGPDGGEYFLGLVSDGAGSASHGRCGASLACEKGRDVIEQWVHNEASHCQPTVPTVRSWVTAIRSHILESAKAKNLNPRNFACTLLGAVIGNRNAVFFQVGDGAIVMGEHNDLHPVFWPDNGQYANMTYFITDDDALDHLQWKCIFLDKPPPLTVKRTSNRDIRVSSCETSLPCEIAMFSDGLQRLALVYQSKTAYQPFFDPMFRTLRQANLAACDRLSYELFLFLGSPQVNERTDDDKTLILAVR